MKVNSLQETNSEIYLPNIKFMF